MSNWKVYAKKADFAGISQRFGIDQVTARIMRNRDVNDEESIKMFLNGTIEDMHNPHMLKDADKAAQIIVSKINAGKHIRIIGDYDIDGICSTCILVKGLKKCNAKVSYTVPHRITDGYGINERLIDDAISDGVDTIVTCDNGIAAIEQINYAIDNGVTVIVTDHHEIPFVMENDKKVFLSSKAQAIVNPKQEECTYPYKLLCGAGVAYKLVQVLFDRMKLEVDMSEYLQLMAIATVGDIVELQDENRIAVKEGLKLIRNTDMIGLKALIEACQLEGVHISSYHIGFVIGPCLNASGRLDTAKDAIELLLTDDLIKARQWATQLCSMNEERKRMTEEETQKAISMVESKGMADDNVLVIYLPQCHESIAGIIAGRVREKYYRPTFVITDSEEGAKGSGRSIEGYNMFDELNKCKMYLTKFGGHPMAAGLSLEKENIDKFRTALNHNENISEADLEPVVWIDVPMPVGYASITLVEQFRQLEPFGKGNEKPVFADRNLLVKSSNVIGKNKNVLKLMLEANDGSIVNGIMFRFDKEDTPQRGQLINVVYYPDINEYNGIKSMQIIIQEIKVIRK